MRTVLPLVCAIGLAAGLPPSLELFASYRLGSAEILLAVDNLFDVGWNEAQFATTSRLRGEPDPVTELHFTPGAGRSIQLGAGYRF